MDGAHCDRLKSHIVSSRLAEEARLCVRVFACVCVCVCVSVHFVCPIADVPRLIIDWLLRCAPLGRWADIYIVNNC